MSVPPQHERLVDLLHDVNCKMAEHIREVFRGREIPVAFRAVGAVLMSEPGVTVSDLARRTGMAKSHISNTVEEHRWRQVRDAVRERLAELVAEIPDDKAAARAVLAGHDVVSHPNRVRQAIGMVFQDPAQIRRGHVAYHLREAVREH